MMKPVLISALDLWASWQREAALNMTRAALMPLAAFASMARSAEAARGQRMESDEGRPPVWQGGGRITSISDVRSGQQDHSASGEAAPCGAKDADADLGTQTEMRKARGGVRGATRGSCGVHRGKQVSERGIQPVSGPPHRRE